MTAIPPTAASGKFVLSDYLTKKDIERVTNLKTTAVTMRIISGAILNDHYIIGDKQTKYFKKSYIKDKLKSIKPTFNLNLIDDYIQDNTEAVVSDQLEVASDNSDLVQSLNNHVQSLSNQIDNLRTDGDQKQLIIERLLELNKNYQIQVQNLISRDVLATETPKLSVSDQNDINNQTKKEKPKSWLWWLGF